MKTRYGMTLFEVLISMTIAVMVFLILGLFVSNSLRYLRAADERGASADQANNVVEYVTRIIRQAQPSPTGAYPIVAASSTSLTFYSAPGAPNVIQKIRLFLEGSQLKQGVINPVGTSYPSGNEVVTVILDGVRNGATTALFDYFDANYTGSQSPMTTVTLADVRLVRITVIYDKDVGRPPGSTSIVFTAQFRNLKTNY
jgi:hypothetical protein